MKQLPMVKKLKDRLKKNPNIKLVNLNIPLTDGSEPVALKQILEDEVDAKYYINDEKANKIMSLANMDHESRKDIIKKKKPIPQVGINNIEEDQYICTSHLGQNGGLTSEISRTVTCTDTPHVTVDE